MSFSFSTSLSGLNANSNALGVVGNNIANANTIGFRNGSITFQDVYAESTGARLNGAGNPLQIGNGVQTGAIHTSFKEGSLNESDSGIQAAIQGNGFFVVKGTDGTSSYTRAGDFTVNKEGYVIASNGAKVQGYQAQNGTVATGTALSSLQIPIGQTQAPQVTTNATLRLNLNADSATGSVFHAPVQVYDSRGTVHSLDLAFTRQSDGSFQMASTMDGTAVQSGNTNFTFDTDGNLTSPSALQIVPDQTQLNGATLPSVSINLRDTNTDGTPGEFNITSYSKTSAVASTVQDGYSAGELNGATVDPDGKIFGTFSNGQSRAIGQYAVATFNSNESLQRSGGNMFTETLASGQANVGAANTGGRGSIAGGYTEQSNTNITNEFVGLIEAQRGFQANSRVITSLNQTFQDLLQIV